MKRFVLALAATAALAVTPAVAQDEELTVGFEALTPETALSVAQATLQACRDKGFQIAVAVTDRNGLVQVVLRDRYAGVHTVDTATRKAWTAASFKTNTIDLAKVTIDEPAMVGLRHITQALPLGGGIYIENGEGALIAAVGVSGAPGGDIDHECAVEGAADVTDQLMF